MNSLLVLSCGLMRSVYAWHPPRDLWKKFCHVCTVVPSLWSSPTALILIICFLPTFTPGPSSSSSSPSNSSPVWSLTCPPSPRPGMIGNKMIDLWLSVQNVCNRYVPKIRINKNATRSLFLKQDQRGCLFKRLQGPHCRDDHHHQPRQDLTETC